MKLHAFSLAFVLCSACAPFGSRATGDRKARMERSPQWHDGAFENPEPIVNDYWETLKGMFNASPDVDPKTPVDVARPDPQSFAEPAASGLRVTWLGHSTNLVEIDGYRILTDPVWSPRVSPVSFVGPKQWFDPPIAFAALPPVDAVVISHDHMDHLDYGTIQLMKAWNARFYVPLGLGAHLEGWGIPPERIVEMDWWEEQQLGELKIVCVPSRHASGRQVLDYYATLWSGFALMTPRHRVYYSGDTGLFKAMKEIGERLGPFDLTMIEAGQYGAGWPDWHLGPEYAVLAHRMVGGKLLLPVHWAKFALAAHGWTEPIERVLVAAQERGIPVVAPRVGESFDPMNPPPVTRWWPDVPWEKAPSTPRP